MLTSIFTPTRLVTLGVALLLAATAPSTIFGQEAANADASATVPVKDLPLADEELQRFVGVYRITIRNSDEPPVTLRLYEAQGRLMGMVNDDDATRMLNQGGNVLRPEAASEYVLTFTIEGARATRFVVESPQGMMDGVRVE